MHSRRAGGAGTDRRAGALRPRGPVVGGAPHRGADGRRGLLRPQGARRQGCDRVGAETPAPTPLRPFIVMNPHSGGGKVEKFDLRRKAEALGAEVYLLEGPESVDVTALARRAVTRGADLLGVAGGDGTQALVAAVAAEHGVPFLVISAGTRNHFALDLGLDRDDPAACLDALTDGVELRVGPRDDERSSVRQQRLVRCVRRSGSQPAYRDDKTGTVLQMLPDLLGAHRDSGLTATIDGVAVEGPQAVLVSNGPYRTTDLAGLGRRECLDAGVLGVVTVCVNSARQAVGLLQGGHARGLMVPTRPRSSSTPTRTRSPSGSTVNPSRSAPRSSAPSRLGRCGCRCRGCGRVCDR